MLDTNTIPHGGKATSNTPSPGARLSVRVVIRPELLNKMLPDGRVYGPGEHTIQIYKGDLPNLECLVETRPELLDQARSRHAAKVQGWVNLTRKKDANGYPTGPEGANVEGNYTGGSVQTEFRELTIGEPDGRGGVRSEGRGIRPLLSVDVIDQLGSVKDEEHRNDVRMRAEEARAQIVGQPVGMSMADIEALVEARVKAAVAALTDPTPAPDAGRKAGK
ncbi:MAG: hypothetical protein WC211_00815 [Dehalococcoidia bacterium]